MYNVRYALSILWISISLISCSGLRPIPTPNIPMVSDPTFNWDNVTSNCKGEPLTGVRYNLFILSGTDPLPTIKTSNEVPCANLDIVDRSKIAPINLNPITELEYHVDLADGLYIAGVEAIGSNNAAGSVTQIQFHVLNRPNSNNILTVK